MWGEKTGIMPYHTIWGLADGSCWWLLRSVDTPEPSGLLGKARSWPSKGALMDHPGGCQVALPYKFTTGHLVLASDVHWVYCIILAGKRQILNQVWILSYGPKQYRPAILRSYVGLLQCFYVVESPPLSLPKNKTRRVGTGPTMKHSFSCSIQ